MKPGNFRDPELAQYVGFGAEESIEELDAETVANDLRDMADAIEEGGREAAFEMMDTGAEPA